MERNTIILTIVSIIVGALLSWLTAWYYFIRSKKTTALTPYLEFNSKIFSGIEPELRKDLIIRYKDEFVENLHQIQFVIFNSGNKSIKNVINPLELTIPAGYEILDAKIVQIFAEGRQIDIVVLSKTIVKFDIPLLNSGEFFRLKLLLKGNTTSPSIDGIKRLNEVMNFKITLDELPPILTICHLPDMSSSKKEIRREVLFEGSLALIFLLGFVLALLKKSYDTASLNGFLALLFILVTINWLKKYQKIKGPFGKILDT